MLTECSEFEVLEMLRKRKRQIVKLKDNLGYWLTAQEEKQFDNLLRSMNKDIQSLVDICYERHICPECGGDMCTKTWVEDTCGYVSCHYCAECGHKEDE